MLLLKENNGTHSASVTICHSLHFNPNQYIRYGEEFNTALLLVPGE